MSSDTENRNAWRFIDFLKDILMHHRKFTPFQKLMILTFIVGVMLGIFRNLWVIGITVTYGVSIYLSVTMSGFILARKTYLASDVLLTFCNHVVMVIANFIQQQNVKIVSNQMEAKQSSENHLKHSEEQTQEDQFYDAPDQTPVRIKIISQSQKRFSDYSSPETNSVSQEIDTILQYIHRDFVQSWYKLFSSDEEGLMEAEVLLHNIFNDVQLRAQKQDRFELAQILMLIFSNHVCKVRQAQMMLKAQRKRRRSSVKPKPGSDNIVPGPLKSLNVVYKTLEDCFAAKTELHPAVRNKEMEQLYQKAVVEVIMLNVLEDNITEVKTIVCALKEILMCNILQSVLSLISDSTFLHERIIKITSNEELFHCKENEPVVQIEESVISDNTVNTEDSTSNNTRSSSKVVSQEVLLSQKYPNVADSETIQIKISNPYDGLLPLNEEEKKETKWIEDTKEYRVPKGICYECNRLCSKDKDRISPRVHSCSLGTTPVFFDADRLSLDSFESFDSIPQDGKPVSEKSNSAPITPTTEYIPDIKIDNATEHDSVFEDSMQCKDTKENQVTSENWNSMPQVESAENGNKNVSDIFFNFLPNPLNALPMLRKKSVPGLGGRNRSSPSLVEEKSECVEIRKSVSIEEIQRNQSSSSTPLDVIPWPVDGPSVFQDVRLTGTETAKEPNGSSVYTLYTIEYEALYQSEEDLVHRTGFVKRRFREFINLQSRLEDNSSYKDSLRDIKGPKKLIPSLPFGNMGKDTLENRKKLLESFLQALINRQDICNGEELKQFLGYSGDGHIAFVRKNPEAPARIDQRLVKTMSGVFDKIVEGLPSLPPQLPRIMTSSTAREDKEEDIKPLEDLDHLELDFSTEQDQQTLQKLNGALDRFMANKLSDLVFDEESSGDTTLGVSSLEWQDKQTGFNISAGQVNHKSYLSTSDPESEHQISTPNLSNGNQSLDVRECPLTTALLDLLADLLSGQDSWICRDNVNHLTKVILGKGLNRYLESKVELLTSEEMNTFYLRTLRETLWPDDHLSTESRPHYTDGQKEILKNQASRCLANFLPDMLPTLIGKEDFSHLVQEIFETIQYENLNRHFWYTAIDILLERLFPEVSSVELQRKLSVTPEHS